MTGAKGKPPHRDVASAGFPVVFSVDLDEWYHCRWATGSSKSLWSDTRACFQETYGTDRPRGDLSAPTEWVLDALAAEGIQATFFVLGEIGRWYPGLVRKIAEAGHEIACHGLQHRDMTDQDSSSFRVAVAEARDVLEQLSGAVVAGYRSPNFVVASYLAEELLELGFRYDSSVCPSPGFRGKYGGMYRCPQHPYRVGRTVQEPGFGPLWELPVTTFPLLRLPACCGLATRLMTAWWSRFALWYWRRTGPVQYYFHPYELWYDLLPPRAGVCAKLYMAGRGRRLQGRLLTILERYSSAAVSAGALVDLLEVVVPGDTIGA